MKEITIFKAMSLITIFTTFLLSENLSSNSISTMVAKIKEERVGISLIKLNDTVSPFIMKIPEKKEIKELTIEEVLSAPEVVYTLKAILNHSAFIDKKWYKEGDTLGNYKVGNIAFSSVVLLSSLDNKILHLKKKNKSFIKLNRGYE